MTLWTETREAWILMISETSLMRVIAGVALRYAQTDETAGDMVETRDTLLWLSTRGAQGRDWGHAGAIAEQLGLWPFETQHLKGNR
jgi:hypothetical protein